MSCKQQRQLFFADAIHASNPSEAEDYTINLILPCGNSTTSWNGTAWTNGLPDERKAVVFNANYTSYRNY